jgi:hypothetical protein
MALYERQPAPGASSPLPTAAFSSDLPRGRYELAVAAVGYVPGSFGQARPDGPGLVVTLVPPAQLSGALSDGVGRPTSDLSMILFPTDRALWFQGSRRLRAPVRPASNGRFSFTGLPPGEYYLAALTDFDPNDWYDPEFLEQVVPGAIKVTLADGERKTQDLKLAGGK